MNWYLLNKGDEFRLERLGNQGLVREREADWFAVGIWETKPRDIEVEQAVKRFTEAFLNKENN